MLNVNAEEQRSDLLWLKSALGLSMQDLAIVCNVSPPCVYHWLDEMAPGDPAMVRVSQLKQWIEQNIAETFRKQIKHIWHMPIDLNVTLLNILHQVPDQHSLVQINLVDVLPRLLAHKFR